MKLLVLGGTVFLGRHIVDAALGRGHDVTLFTRGLHHPDLYPELERLTGDRDGNLNALKGRRWDAVIDTSGFVPRIVGDSAQLLADAVEHYTFISSVSVYANFSQSGLRESDALATLTTPGSEDVQADYGALKALCEDAAEQAMQGRVLNIRPGLIVGPYDKTDRFTYWPTRIADGGEVLAPGSGSQPVQIIDARDLAEWTLRMVEARQTGVYNATGPKAPFTLQTVLETCQQVSGSDAHFTWVDEGFLVEQEVGQWMELPLWIAEENMRGMLAVNVERAVDAGLTFRSLEDTIRATLEWDRTRPPDEERKAGLARAREADLLRAWKTRNPLR